VVRDIKSENRKFLAIQVSSQVFKQRIYLVKAIRSVQLRVYMGTFKDKTMLKCLKSLGLRTKRNTHQRISGELLKNLNSRILRTTLNMLLHSMPKNSNKDKLLWLIRANKTLILHSSHLFLGDLNHIFKVQPICKTPQTL
jgi:hypothetical protein